MAIRRNIYILFSYFLADSANLSVSDGDLVEWSPHVHMNNS